MGRLPVFKAIGATLAYFFTHSLELLKAIWLPCLLFTVATLYLLPKYMEPMLAVMELGATPNPQAVAAAMGPAMQWLGLILLAAFIFQPMAYVAGMRHVLRGESLRAPFYLGFGGDELRMAGTFILMMIIIVIVYAVGGLAFIALSAALGALAKGAAAPVIAILSLAFVGVLLWLALRLSMSMPASLAERRIGVPYAWRAGKGNSLRLLFYYLVWLLIMVPVVGLYMMIIMPNFMDYMREIAAAGQDAAKAQEVQLRMTREQVANMSPGSPGFPLRALGIYAYQLFMTAIWTVPPAIAYRFIAGERAR